MGLEKYSGEVTDRIDLRVGDGDQRILEDYEDYGFLIQETISSQTTSFTVKRYLMAYKNKFFIYFIIRKEYKYYHKLPHVRNSYSPAAQQTSHTVFILIFASLNLQQ